MNRLLIVLTSILLLMVIRAHGQEIEHNYKVGPQNVSCDSLSLPSGDLLEAIQLVREAKYRYVRSFKMTRKQGLQGGEFLACDGTLGFLIVRFDNQEVLYTNIDKSVWESFTSSADPEGFYVERRAYWKKYE